MVLINGNTELDYCANFIHKEITAPEPKIELVEIPLSDGAINASALLSDHVFYQTRTLTIGLELRAIRKMWPILWSTILDDLHGQSVNVSFSDDPNWYWIGTASVGKLEDHGSTAGVTITVNAQPFKRTHQQYVAAMADTVAGTGTYTIDINHKRAYPSFTVTTSGFTVKYDGETWSLPSGKSSAYGLVLHEGENELGVHGSGKITIEYEGGSL